MPFFDGIIFYMEETIVNCIILLIVYVKQQQKDDFQVEQHDKDYQKYI
jgi:hypothetical protein